MAVARVLEKDRVAMARPAYQPDATLEQICRIFEDLRSRASATERTARGAIMLAVALEDAANYLMDLSDDLITSV